MVTTVPAQTHRPRSHLHLLPQTALGWWGFGLMLFAVAACPASWAILTPLIGDPNTHIRTATVIAIAVPSLVVGALALIRREARSVLLIAVWTIFALAIAWAVLFAATID